MHNGDGPDSADRPSGENHASRWQRIIAYPNCYLECRRTHQKQETTQDRAVRRTARATVWIAGFTLVAIVVGAFQFIAMRGQQRIMQGQLDEMRAEQRAYIYFDGFDAQLALNGNARIGVLTPVFVNGGNTGTHTLHIGTVLIYNPTALDEPWNWVDWHKMPIHSHVIGPKQRYPGPPIPSFTQQLIAAIDQRSQFAYICGFARYKDSVGGTAWHITEFCYYLSGLEIQTDPTTKTPKFIYSALSKGDHDCADEDCPDYQYWQSWKR